MKTLEIERGVHVLADDNELLEIVQRQTFAYFWNYGHPISGMARDRGPEPMSDRNDIIAVGASGFGVMAIIIAAERGWISRDAAVQRLKNTLAFLRLSDCYRGVFPHFLNGATGEEIEGRRETAGGDVVETSYLFMGLLSARQYFDHATSGERELRRDINELWRSVQWDWYTAGNGVLRRHWHPDYGWDTGVPLGGWNEGLITHVLAASSPTHPIHPSVYHKGWANGDRVNNGKVYCGAILPLSPDHGGSIHSAQYGFLGIDPRSLWDIHTDYWNQTLLHMLAHYEYYHRNPKKFRGYGPDCWGLAACDGDHGSLACAPDNDCGVIVPSVALSSFPYTPRQSMRALRHYYFDLGERLWREYGFLDAFNETTGWTAHRHTAVNQGSLIGMIENYRTGLLWRLFMSCPEVQQGLDRLGFYR